MDVVRTGEDTIRVGAGRDAIFVPEGRDRILSDFGSDTIISDQDNDAKEFVDCGAGYDHAQPDPQDTVVNRER
jgi:hypothetical protein